MTWIIMVQKMSRCVTIVVIVLQYVRMLMTFSGFPGNQCDNYR